jgi:hypothetical protein
VQPDVINKNCAAKIVPPAATLHLDQMNNAEHGGGGGVILSVLSSDDASARADSILDSGTVQQKLGRSTERGNQLLASFKESKMYPLLVKKCQTHE